MSPEAARLARTWTLEPLGALPGGLHVLYGRGKTPDLEAAWPLTALLGWLTASQDR